MDYKLEDLIDVPLLQSLQDKLNVIYSFPSAIIDNDGKILTAVAWQDICTKFHRLNSECVIECVKSDQYILDHIHEASPAVSYQCPHGLIDNATPIVIDGKHLGNFFTGQFFLEEPDIEFFKKQAKRFDFNETDYLEAVKKVPVWTKEKLGQYLDFIKGFIEIIASLGLKNLKEKEAEKTLRESEEKYSMAFNVSPYAIVITNIENGNFIEVNQGFTSITGYTKEEAINSSSISLSLWVDVNDRNGVISDLGEGRDVVGKEFRFRKKNGEILIGLYTASVIQIKNKPYILSSINDITDRKKAELELRKLSRAVEQSPVSIVITDLEGNIVYGNPKVCELTGYSIGELAGKNPRILQSGETPKETYRDLWDTIRSGNEWKGEFHNKKKNGELYWESVSISPIIDSKGKTTNYLAVKEDVTERKNMVTSLEAALVKAEAGNRLKTAFMNNISHEIRTPLNGILGFSSLFALHDISREEQEQYYSLIKRSSDRLLSTVTNYMDISLIVSGTMEAKMKRFNLQQFLHQIRDQFDLLCTEKNIKMQLEIPPESDTVSLYSDQELLRKIISHLLDNAVKFTSKGGVGFGYRILAGTLEFYVKDTGIGINKESGSLIFETFVQEELTTSRAYEGSGLGLSIAKGLVQLLGGDMRIESEKGRGSAVFFTIPYQEVNKEDHVPEAIPADASDQRNPVILIAEDDESTLLFIQAVFRKTPVNLIAVDNGIDAVQHCREHPEISLVIMDIKMPLMDGLEATRQIKSFRRDLPIIALTAFAMSGDEKKAMDAGCDDYIAKPVAIDLLLKKLKKYGLSL